MHVTNKFVPKHPNPPPPPDYWNELLFPREFPLAFFEMSFLLPHFLKEGRGKLDVYFTRVYNPLWTNPDGFSWMEVLQDRDEDRAPRRADADLERDRVVCRLHPADGARDRASRHDESGDARRPVARVPSARACASRAPNAASRSRRPTNRIRARCGRRANSGSRSAGRSIRTARSGSASSSSRPSDPASQSRWTSTTAGYSSARSPACLKQPPRKISRHSSTCASTASSRSRSRAYSRGFERTLEAGELTDTTTDGDGRIVKNGTAVGIAIDGVAYAGFNTPSRLLEFYSDTMVAVGLARACPASIRDRSRALARPEARPKGSSICSPTSVCRRSSTPDRRSSGCTRSRTTTRSGSRPTTRRGCGLRPAISSRSGPASGIS